MASISTSSSERASTRLPIEGQTFLKPALRSSSSNACRSKIDRYEHDFAGHIDTHCGQTLPLPYLRGRVVDLEHTQSLTQRPLPAYSSKSVTRWRPSFPISESPSGRPSSARRPNRSSDAWGSMRWRTSARLTRFATTSAEQGLPGWRLAALAHSSHLRPLTRSGVIPQHWSSRLIRRGSLQKPAFPAARSAIRDRCEACRWSRPLLHGPGLGWSRDKPARRLFDDGQHLLGRYGRSLHRRRSRPARLAVASVTCGRVASRDRSPSSARTSTAVAVPIAQRRPEKLAQATAHPPDCDGSWKNVRLLPSASLITSRRGEAPPDCSVSSSPSAVSRSSWASRSSSARVTSPLPAL